MSANNKVFWVGHSLITVFIVGVIIMCHYWIGNLTDLYINIGGVLWVSLLTLIAYLINIRNLHGTTGAFTNSVMGAMMLKMLLSIVFIGLVLFLSTVNRKGFIASYFSAFFLLGFFEIYCILNNLRPK